MLIRSFFIGILVVELYKNTNVCYKTEQNMTWYKISQQVTNTSTYTVVEGDSLSAIAKKMLNDISRWPEIQKLNNIVDPNKIKPGQVLKMPSNVVVPENANIQSKEDVYNQTSMSRETALEELKQEIARGEGNYYSYNRGYAGDTKRPVIDITKLTVQQIMDKQSTKLADGKRQLFAVGKYQMIPVTLAEAVRNPNVGVSVSDMFTPEVQEKLFMHLIYKRPNLMAYINGKNNDIDAAVNDLAAEFASLPTTSGKGRYDKDSAGNKATGGLERVEKIKRILMSIRGSK